MANKKTRRNKHVTTFFYHYHRSIFTFYLNRKQFFHLHKHSKIRTREVGERERERERAWICFFFMWWEGLRDKGCDAMPVEFSLDQSCSQRQHNDEHKWLPASTLETRTAATAPIRFPAQEPLIGIPGWRWVCRSLGWRDQEKKKKQKTDLSEIPGGRENGAGALKWMRGL